MCEFLLEFNNKLGLKMKNILKLHYNLIFKSNTMFNTIDDNQFVDANYNLDSYIAKSVVYSQLLDFSTNNHNIKNYIKYGQAHEILKYTNISFAVLSGMKNAEKIYGNDNLMIHVLENCSDIVGLLCYDKFQHYSLNVIRKIFESTSKNFIVRFDNYINIHYKWNDYECHEKIIYILEYYLTNDQSCKIGVPNGINIYEYCWNIYLDAHKYDPKADYRTRDYKADIYLIDKLQNLFKKFNVEEQVFKRTINLRNRKFTETDIRLLKKTPYLMINKITCSIM